MWNWKNGRKALVLRRSVSWHDGFTRSLRMMIIWYWLRVLNTTESSRNETVINLPIQCHISCNVAHFQWQSRNQHQSLQNVPLPNKSSWWPDCMILKTTGRENNKEQSRWSSRGWSSDTREIHIRKTRKLSRCLLFTGQRKRRAVLRQYERSRIQKPSVIIWYYVELFVDNTWSILSLYVPVFYGS